MKVNRTRDDHVLLIAGGAEIDALYRAALNAYGPDDCATQDLLHAVVNWQNWPTWSENLDPDEAISFADGIEEVGMRATASLLRGIAADIVGDALEAEIKALS